MKQRTPVLIATVLVALVWTTQSRAQAVRTYVAVAGNDVNDCTFGTPCRTFAGAVPKTAPGGEITALDSGTYGAVTVDRALTLQAAPGAHVALGDGRSFSAVTISVGASDVVVLRRLHVSGSGSTQRGIYFSGGWKLHIEGCVVTGFPDAGIRFEGDCTFTGCSELFVKDTIARNNGEGIRSFSVFGSLDHCRFENNTTGVHTDLQASLKIRDSVIAGNSTFGLVANMISGASLDNCTVTHNGTGIRGSGPAGSAGSFIVSNTLIAFNTTALSPSGGEIRSFGNNRLAGNTTNGAFTQTIPQQ